MQQNDPSVQGPLIAGAAILIIAFAALIGLAIQVGICWLIASALGRVPAEHRKMEPGMVWLLLIPCFNLVWNFFVFQRIPDSFASYFRSQGRTDVGDCGKQIGLWYAICVVAACVPLLNYLAGPAALVLLILNLVKFHELKGKLAA